MKHYAFKISRILGRFQSITRPLLKITFISFFIFIIFLSIKYTHSILKNYGLTNKDLLSFTKDPKEFLDTTNDSTNFLILGLRGEGGEAFDLTDTIIILSYNHNNQLTSLISVPRDLWVNSLKTKINAAYHYGNQKETNGGFILVKAAIQETLGVPIHYSTVINFKGFIEIIDLLGGLDIEVENAFVDTRFPIPGKENVFPEKDRYKTIKFEAGYQHMDGQTALEFVRSRYAEGPEGTDFARSRRQQLVINALRSRLISTNFLFDKDKITTLNDIIIQNLTTEITPNLYPPITKIVLNIKDKPLNKISLSSEKENGDIAVLETPPAKLYDNQWVLIARDNNWEALKLYIANKLNGIQ